MLTIKHTKITYTQFLQLLQQKLLLNDSLMVCKKKEKVINTTCNTTSWHLFKC